MRCRCLLLVLLVWSAVAFPQTETMLTASDPAEGQYFGRSVTIDGDTAVIGASGDAAGGVSAGAAYVFVRSDGTWTEQQKLTASDAATSQYFGTSVALDGDTVVIGAYGDASWTGAVYVFTLTGGVWTEQQKLVAADGETNDLLGFSVALDGDTAVIGAQGESGRTGAAYLFTRSGAVWTEEQKLVLPGTSDFGHAVAIDGDVLIVGASGENLHQGAAYVYLFAYGVWTAQQRLNPASLDEDANFGAWVSVNGDSVMVGAMFDGADAGSAYVFTRSAGLFTEQQKLTANDTAGGEFFGRSVVIEGDVAVVGAYYDDGMGGADQGSAYVFTRSDGAWSQRVKLTAADAAADDHFGIAVSVSGQTAVIGACDHDVSASGSGSVYVYTGAPIPVELQHFSVQ